MLTCAADALMGWLRIRGGSWQWEMTEDRAGRRDELVTDGLTSFSSGELSAKFEAEMGPSATRLKTQVRDTFAVMHFGCIARYLHVLANHGSVSLSFQPHLRSLRLAVSAQLNDRNKTRWLISAQKHFFPPSPGRLAQ
jgi:hypothetical protein